MKGYFAHAPVQRGHVISNQVTFYQAMTADHNVQSVIINATGN